MEERLDILDKEGNPTGESETSHEIHRLGLKHRAVHVWFLNSKKQLLLQKRSVEKASYPGFWDISAAGHVSSGDTAVVTAKRETQEELGLTPPIGLRQFCFLLDLAYRAQEINPKAH